MGVLDSLCPAAVDQYKEMVLVGDQMVQVKIPQLGREEMERIISGITMPEMPMDMRQQVIDVLAERGRWIEEKVQQINRVYPEPVPRVDRQNRSR